MNIFVEFWNKSPTIAGNNKSSYSLSWPIQACLKLKICSSCILNLQSLLDPIDPIDLKIGAVLYYVLKHNSHFYYVQYDTVDDFMQIFQFHFRMQMKNLMQYSLWYAFIIDIYS